MARVEVFTDREKTAGAPDGIRRSYIGEPRVRTTSLCPLIGSPDVATATADLGSAPLSPAASLPLHGSRL